MVRIYLSHLELESQTQSIDPPIKTNQDKIISETVNFLCDKYDVPNIIFCSPYNATRTTAICLAREILKKYDKKVEILIDKSLSEYLGDKIKQQNINLWDMDKETRIYEPIIYEVPQDFRARVRFNQKIYKLLELNTSSYWFITHNSFIDSLVTNYRTIGYTPTKTMEGFILDGNRGTYTKNLKLYQPCELKDITRVNKKCRQNKI